jgi:hypothetical protein
MTRGWGGGTPPSAKGEKNVALNTEERIERLLDQLEDPALSDDEVEKIKQKVNYLRSLDEES